MPRARLLFRARHELAEGPVWHDGALWWVDIEGRTLSRGDPQTGGVTEQPLPCRVSAIVPCSGGRWLTANERGFGFLDRHSGRIAMLGGDLPQPARLRINDGKCDLQGRFLAGSMHEDTGTGMARLYSVGRTLRPRVLLDGLTLSNGLGWSPDGTKFYHIDTAERRIDVYDYAPQTGILCGKRTLACVAQEDGFPDGMAVDRDGNLWVSLWGGAAVNCYDGRSGALVERIDCPVTQPSSCCFGGTEMDMLFITSARHGLPESQIRREPLAGSVFVATPGPRGLPVSVFQEEEQTT